MKIFSAILCLLPFFCIGQVNPKKFPKGKVTNWHTNKPVFEVPKDTAKPIYLYDWLSTDTGARAQFETVGGDYDTIKVRMLVELTAAFNENEFIVVRKNGWAVTPKVLYYYSGQIWKQPFFEEDKKTLIDYDRVWMARAYNW